jgi:hypothetical protein
MKPSKRKKAQMALMFLTEKRDKSAVKGRAVYIMASQQENGYLKKMQQAQLPHWKVS